MKEIIIASGNKGKIRETQDILNEYKIISMNELGINIDVEEDGKTFKEKAIAEISDWDGLFVVGRYVVTGYLLFSYFYFSIIYHCNILYSRLLSLISDDFLQIR